LTQHRRKVVTAAVIAAVAAGLVYFAARGGGSGFDWPVFVATVTRLDWGWLGLALAAAYGTYVVRALRWAVPIEPRGRPAEMVRPYLIANNEGVPFCSQVAAWVVERIYDCLIALAVFGFAVSEVSASGVHTGAALSWAPRVAGGAIALGAAVGLMDYADAGFPGGVPF
jgi:glycosyltransferase 2 family protein